MNNLFDKVMIKVFKSEGGYTDDPVDNGNWTGGKQNKGRLIGTNHGISAPILEQWTGSEQTANDMKNLTKITAKKIYWDLFWTKCHADKLPKSVRYIHYDTSINHGITGASKILQRVIGVDDDGKIGRITLGKANRATLEAYAIERMCEYGRLITGRPVNAKYAKGWMNRVKEAVTYTNNKLI